MKRPDAFRFVDAAFHNLSSPVRWKSKDWQKVVLISGGVSALTLLDKPVRELWEPMDSQFLDRVNALGDSYGRTYGALIFSGGFYFTGILFKDEWARETGVMLGSALLTSCAAQAILKPLVGRARPFMEQGNYEFAPFRKEGDWHSFPSGHTAIALTISFVLAERVHSRPLKILFYALAGSTVVCRLYSDAHWISDIGFGGAVAWFSARSSVNRVASTRFKQDVRERWSLSPYPGGLTLRVKL